MKITVRRARQEDVEGIYNVIKLAFEKYRKIGYPEVAIQSATISRSEIQRRIKEELMLATETESKLWEL